MFGSLGSRSGRGSKGILKPGSGLVSAAAPGDIIENYDAVAPGDDWVELDGSTITDGVRDNPGVAKRYGWMVSGNNLVLPDRRGTFDRVWANGSSNDPDRASRTARAGDGQTGDYPGTNQADGAPNIYGYAGNYVANNIAGGTDSGALTTTMTLTGALVSGGVNYGHATLSISAKDYNARYDDNNTDIRPTNHNVCKWMKLG